MNRKRDTEIKQQVLRELKWDSRITWSEIGVEVFEGVVTLTGTVDSYAKKRAAQEAAHRIDGVLDVANEVEVRPTGEFTRTESDIALESVMFCNGMLLFPLSAFSRLYRTAG